MSDRISDGILRQIIGDDKPDAPSCNISKDRHMSWGLEGYPLAMVYAPIQCFKDVYDLDTALMQGTVFKELDLPFKGESVGKGGMCRG